LLGKILQGAKIGQHLSVISERCSELNAIIVVLIAVSALIVMLIMRLPLYIILGVVPIMSALMYGGGSFLKDVINVSITSRTTWGLVLNVFVISWLVSLYRSLHVIDRLGKELSKAFRSDILALTIVPGAIGLLPVAGGALMSAPIVNSIGETSGISRIRRNFANVWYRHVLIYVYPLNSTLIITSSVFSINLVSLVKDQIPIAVFMFLIGLPVIGFRVSKKEGKVSAKNLLRDFSPIIVSAFLAFILFPIDRYFPIERVSVTIAALVGIAVFLVLENARFDAIKSSFKDRKIWELTLISFEIMVFRALFSEMDLSPLVTAISKSGLSESLLIMTLPVFFSFISGSPSAGIAISAPILQSIVGTSRGIADLVYAAAFMGYLGSPLHLCYVYSSEYFGVSMVKSYKYMLPMSMTSLLFAWILYILFWL